jgi:hypothetical protein
MRKVVMQSAGRPFLASPDISRYAVFKREASRLSFKIRETGRGGGNIEERAVN